MKVGRFPVRSQRQAIALGEDQGLIKTDLRCERPANCSVRIMVGTEVTELIQGFVVAMNLETTEEELMNTVFRTPLCRR